MLRKITLSVLFICSFAFADNKSPSEIQHEPFNMKIFNDKAHEHFVVDTKESKGDYKEGVIKQDYNIQSIKVEDVR